MTSSLNQIVANSLWFAFDALDQHKTGVVDKARLKELTRQIGEALLLDRSVQDCLADYRSTDTLTFDQFLHFLEYEVFSDVCNGSTPYCEVERHHTALDALCWEVGRHSLAPRYPAVLTQKDTYKAFRIFCMLADRTSAGGDLIQVSVRRSEVCEVCRHLVDDLGLDWDWGDWQLVSGTIDMFPLPVFLTFIEGRYGQSAEPSALEAAVEAVYKYFVGQVFFQGKAYQRITKAGGWLRRDIEIVPWAIRATVDTSEECPDQQGGIQKPASPNKIQSAVGRSLTLGRNAVGVMGGAVKTGVSEVVERSRTLSRGVSLSPTKKSTESETTSAAEGESETGTPKRGFSLGRWGSASGINKKKNKAAEKDTASLGGRESPGPTEKRRSRTLDRASMRSSKSASTLDSPKSPSNKPGRPPVKESTKGVVGGIIGRVWRLDIHPETTVTSLKDTTSGRPCKISVINTHTARPIVIAASDHKSKARMLAAVQESIKHCQDPLPYQMRMSQSRRSEEEEEEVKASEERMRRSSQADIIEQTQAELALERTAREEAECLAQSEASARAVEEERVVELQTLRQQLETLLQQEQQAKRDEEIVRNLQARVLREEWAKREELERLQQEQQHLLEEEQRKRRAFELLQKDQEKKLREAESRLKSLDGDRRRLDEELRAAREKIVMSGRGKQLLEAKMKVQQGRRPPIRTLSLRPSRQERASPARSSSFNSPPTRLGGIPSTTGPTKSSPGQEQQTPSSLSTPKGPNSPGSAGNTPATTPSGAANTRSLLEYLENNPQNGSSSPPAANSPGGIKSIPELKTEEETETVGWKVSATIESSANGDADSEENVKEEPTSTVSDDVKPVEENVKPVEENGKDSNDETGKKGKDNFIEIKTYEEKTIPMDLIDESIKIAKSVTITESKNPENFDLLSEIDSFSKTGENDEGVSKTVVTKTTTKTEDGVTETVVETTTNDVN